MTHDKASSSMLTYDKMVELLKDFKVAKNRVMLMEYEIANYSPVISDDDVIYQMTFGDKALSDEDNRQYSIESIAMKYGKRANQINVRHKQELEDEVRHLKASLERLDYYVSLLPERQACVLRMIFFESKTIMEVSLSMSISESTVKNARKDGIKKLIEMYSVISC